LEGTTRFEKARDAVVGSSLPIALAMVALRSFPCKF